MTLTESAMPSTPKATDRQVQTTESNPIEGKFAIKHPETEKA